MADVTRSNYVVQQASMRKEALESLVEKTARQVKEAYHSVESHLTTTALNVAYRYRVNELASPQLVSMCAAFITKYLSGG